MNGMTITILSLNAITLLGIVSASVISQKNKSPQFVALYSTFVGVFLTLYLFGLIILSAQNVINRNYASTLLTLFFISSPFVIGNFATYKKAGLYISLQVFLLALSFVCIVKHLV
jgi:hypothetical protein